jgi:hypothetical protein
MAEPRRITVEPGSELDRLLDDVGDEGLLIQRNGDFFRLGRAESTSGGLPRDYDPEAARAAIEATAGSWADVDIDAMIEYIYRGREEGSRWFTA